MILNVYVKIAVEVKRKVQVQMTIIHQSSKKSYAKVCVSAEKVEKHKQHTIVIQLPHPLAHKKDQTLAQTLPLQNMQDSVF